jgi:hypothetical protein
VHNCAGPHRRCVGPVHDLGACANLSGARMHVLTLAAAHAHGRRSQCRCGEVSGQPPSQAVVCALAEPIAAAYARQTSATATRRWQHTAATTTQTGWSSRCARGLASGHPRALTRSRPAAALSGGPAGNTERVRDPAHFAEDVSEGSLKRSPPSRSCSLRARPILSPRPSRIHRVHTHPGRAPNQAAVIARTRSRRQHPRPTRAVRSAACATVPVALTTARSGR